MARAHQTHLGKNDDDVELVTKITQEAQCFPNLVQADPREVPQSPPQRAAAWPPMMALLLGATDAPIKAYSQPARGSEVKWKRSVMPPP